VVPLTRLMPREEIVAAAPNTISFERDPALKARIFDLLSLSTNEANGETRLASLFCCLPGIEAPPSLSYKDTFKVVIIQFLDRYNFDLGSVKRSCIHFATTDGRMIPFDTYNSFYRPGAPGADKLRQMGGVTA
jgi:hypothetical protein